MNDFIKKAVRLIVQIGSEILVAGLAASVTSDDNKLEKATAAVAGLAIGGWIGEKAADYSEQTVDKIADCIGRLGEGKEADDEDGR